MKTYSEPEVYPNIDKAEIERQYFMRAARPNYETVDLPGWIAKSDRFVLDNLGKLDLAYGQHVRNRLDFFPAKGDGQSLVIYIHGGYWQRGDKSVYRFLADNFIRNGMSVALINYPMCPDVRFSEIVIHVRSAVMWLWNHAEELSFSRNEINVIGHSAGGHLTSELMLTNWATQDKNLPNQVIRSGAALSGLYDLSPLLYCSENQGLRLDEREIVTASPINREPQSLRPMLMGYGLKEPPDMHRQTIDFYNKFHKVCEQMDCLGIDADHMDVVNELANPESELVSHVFEYFLSS